MTRWQALTTICGFLRDRLLGAAPQPLECDLSWERIVEVGSLHNVTPALAVCLSGYPKVPSDVRDYFDLIASCNMQRNEVILDGLARVTGLMNAIDVEPILLKGIALLVEGIYPEPSLRLIGDVDILIPVNRSREAYEALTVAGFHRKTSDNVLPSSHHHLPMLHDPESGLAVELHTDVVSQCSDAVVSTAWFCERSRQLVFRNQRLRLPEPTRNIGHIIFHSQILHGLYSRNRIELRHLLDMVLIRAQHESAIDWHEIERRFAAAGFGESLATYLDFANALFAQPAPGLSHLPRKGAMAELIMTESRNNLLQAIQVELKRVTAWRDFYQAELQKITSSKSWRWTGPARKIYTWVKTLKQLVRTRRIRQ